VAQPQPSRQATRFNAEGAEGTEVVRETAAAVWRSLACRRRGNGQTSQVADLPRLKLGADGRLQGTEMRPQFQDNGFCV